MSLMLPIIAIFVLVGLTQSKVGWRSYVRIGVGVLIVAVYYLLTAS